MLYRLFLFALFQVSLMTAFSQVRGTVITDRGLPAQGATIRYGQEVVIADAAGAFELDTTADMIHISYTGFQPFKVKIRDLETLSFVLAPAREEISEVVVTGTMREVTRMESMVPVEVYSAAFLRKNPTPAIFEALQHINGVRPQLNCNVCNTGDIHINGLEGPYTMVLIDGMPIVSSLSTVYGLSGIPTSLVERIEVVKGPASSLYGSEAVGGMVNIITKSPLTAPRFFADIMGTTYKELNVDIGFKSKFGFAEALTGINVFKYDSPKDWNRDGFTDVTLQKRFSVFEKLSFTRSKDREASLALRYFYEDRWGGEMDWAPRYRGGDSVYGESIYTSRWEMIGNYQLPVPEKVMLSFSFNDHRQNSRYGTTAFDASQQVGFAQLTWYSKKGRHELLTGIAARATVYDDNTTATPGRDKTLLPGIFLQDEVAFKKFRYLGGVRYDHHPVHGSILTPRAAVRYAASDDLIVRLNAGTGFRVVNIFTEDHAALTGARDVVIEEELDPERSYNVNLNFLQKTRPGSSFMIVEAGFWYTHFLNRIVADLESDPSRIRYRNLPGHAISRGASLNIDLTTPLGLKINAGATFQDVITVEEKKRYQQLLTEKFMATWSATYRLSKWPLSIDYSGNLYSPMKLPLAGPLDPRPPYSPWWSNQNLQFTITHKRTSLYFGAKNIFDWVPPSRPFIIARSHDPFDKDVVYDGDGNVVATPGNPYALTFDPTYLYAPNQGRRFFAGLRFTFTN